MNLPDPTSTLRTPEAVEAFLARHGRSVLLKLGTCQKNVVALCEVEKQLRGGAAGVPLGLIRVVESRPASDHVAARTGIVHESPQLIVFVDGLPVFERNNRGITPESVREALSLLAVGPGREVEELSLAARAAR